MNHTNAIAELTVIRDSYLNKAATAHIYLDKPDSGTTVPT
jgi:hypothetical protein